LRKGLSLFRKLGLGGASTMVGAGGAFSDGAAVTGLKTVRVRQQTKGAMARRREGGVVMALEEETSMPIRGEITTKFPDTAKLSKRTAGCGRRGLELGFSMMGRDTIRQILVRLGSLGVAREDLEETFVRGRGNGGQKINKTSSTVRLRHVPTGIEVICQEQRQLSQNRYQARVLLCDKLEQRRKAGNQARQAAASKARAQKGKRSAGLKRQMIKTKRLRSEIKATRRAPRRED
jgi:peptide chain release factor